MFFGTEKGNRLELSVNESTCEGAGRVSQGDGAVMENRSRRMAHGDSRSARTSSSREQQSSCFWIFYEAVEHVSCVTDFCRVGRVLYPSWGTTPRNFTGTGVVAALQLVRYLGKTWRSLIFVWWFLVRLLFFLLHVPAGRHSSTPDSRRVRLCSRLPCGSYGAGSTTDSNHCSL